MNSKMQKADNEEIRRAQARKERFDEKHAGEASKVDALEWLRENREQIRRETEGMTPAERREHRRKRIREAGYADHWPEEQKPQEA